MRTLAAIAEQASSALLIVATAAVLAVLVWHWRRAALRRAPRTDPGAWPSSMPIAGLVVATTIVGENFLPPLAVLHTDSAAAWFPRRAAAPAPGASGGRLTCRGTWKAARVSAGYVMRLARELCTIPRRRVAYWCPSQQGVRRR